MATHGARRDEFPGGTGGGRSWPLDRTVAAIMVRQLVRLALVPIDAAGPSRSRLALRKLGWRLRPPRPPGELSDTVDGSR